jgi:Flp pilus assembly protein CpaB
VPITDLAALTTRLGGWPRRVLALFCLVLAAVTALGGHTARHSSTAAGPEHPVVVAARDLAAGTALTSADLRLRSWPDELRPAGALTRSHDVVGRRVAGAVRAGEAFTAARLIGAGLTTGLARDLRAVPVQVSGAGAGLVRAGDSVDLLVSDPPDTAATASPAAHVLAESARVLAVATPSATDSDAGTLDIVVAVDRATSLKLAAVSGRALVASVRNPP